MKTASLSIALIFVAATSGLTQNIEFKVLAAKGTVQMLENGHWGLVRVGARIMSNGEIKVARGSYVGLVHTTGKPVEVLTPGTYKAADLVKSMKSEKSLMEKYTSFILATEKQGRNRLSATGAVHRGNEHIALFLPSETVNVLGSSLTVYWKARHHSKSFDVIVSDMFGNKILRERVENQYIELDLDDEKFTNKGILSIIIQSVDHPGDASSNYYINRLAGEEKRILAERHAELLGAFSEKTPLASMLESAFFEENNLPVEAIMAIHDSKTSQENQEFFMDEYHNLLKRYGIRHE